MKDYPSIYKLNCGCVCFMKKNKDNNFTIMRVQKECGKSGTFLKFVNTYCWCKIAEESGRFYSFTFSKDYIKIDIIQTASYYAENNVVDIE